MNYVRQMIEDNYLTHCRPFRLQLDSGKPFGQSYCFEGESLKEFQPNGSLVTARGNCLQDMLYGKYKFYVEQELYLSEAIFLFNVGNVGEVPEDSITSEETGEQLFMDGEIETLSLNVLNGMFIYKGEPRHLKVLEE
jgi:hypothetical protein